MKKWKKLSTEVVHKNPWWECWHDRFRLPNGKEGDYYYMHVSGVSVAIPILGDGRIILVREYRYIFDQDCIEFPSGGREEGDDFEKTTREELEQEAGYMAGKLELVGQFTPYRGLSDEWGKVYIAADLKKTKNRLEETEEIEVLFKTPEEIDAMIESNEIWDGETLAAWCLARKRVIELIKNQKK